ncbi:MAG: divergent polysaccharide deacetylase family protein [Fibrobacterales bacterium]
MNILKRISVIISLVLLFALAGHYIPYLLKVEPTPLLKEYQYRKRDVKKHELVYATPDSTHYLTLLESEFSPHNVKTRRGKHTWFLSNGVALPVHALAFQNAITKHNCTVDQAKESNRTPRSLATIFTCPNKKTYNVTLKIGEAFTDATAKISIVFQTKSHIPIGDMKLLDDLHIPFTLLIDPYSSKKTIFYDIKKLQSKFETVLLVPMEPIRYPYVNPGKHALYIHNTENELEEKLDDAYSKIPNAIGFATINGTRAIVHDKLLTAILGYAADKQHLFIDLTKSSRSKAPEICSTLDITCPKMRLYTFADMDRYLTKSVSIAQKKGEHTIAIPLTTKNLHAIKKIISQSNETGITFVKLSSLS